MPTLVACVSGHGFGHASRTIEVLNALADRAPELRIVLRGSPAPWLVARTARPGIAFEPAALDTGAVQLDSLRLDAGETIRQATVFMETFEHRRRAEVEALRRLEANLVLADIPPLALAAAADAGIPGVAMGNFTWDWIYAAYPGGERLAEQLGQLYASATRTLRLPLWGGFATTPDIVDLPFVARRSTRTRDEVRARLGWPLDERLVLVSFGGYGVDGLDVEALARLPGYRVVISAATPFRGRPLGREPVGRLLPLDEDGLDEDGLYAGGLRYEDVVGAVDVVASKPGYGIIAECAANGAALLYTSRGAFAEYDVLVAGLPGVLRSAFIPMPELLAGRWQAPLDALLASPPPPAPPRVDGADVAAQLLLDMM